MFDKKKENRMVEDGDTDKMDIYDIGSRCSTKEVSYSKRNRPGAVDFK